MIQHGFSRVRVGLSVIGLAALYLILRIAKEFVPLTHMTRLVWREPRSVRNPEAERRFMARVIRARRLFGNMDRDCLTRSLLLYGGLSRLGADPRLVVGFRKSTSGLEGHACVIIDGRALDDPQPASGEFSAALSFGRRGDLEPLTRTSLATTAA